MPCEKREILCFKLAGMFENLTQIPIIQQTISAVQGNGEAFSWGVGLILFLRVIAILWTMKDIGARTSNVRVQILCILLVGVGTPIIGLPLYLLFRPIRYKWDRLARREALALQIVQCYCCGSRNPLYHDHCVSCGSELTTKCKECKHHYQLHYEYCPACGAPNTEE